LERLLLLLPDVVDRWIEGGADAMESTLTAIRPALEKAGVKIIRVAEITPRR
jgi:hypothetical protein